MRQILTQGRRFPCTRSNQGLYGRWFYVLGLLNGLANALRQRHLVEGENGRGRVLAIKSDVVFRQKLIDVKLHRGGG